MNISDENLLCRIETVGRRQAFSRRTRQSFQFSISQTNPVPLWQRARVQANGFHHGDLERAHWGKVWRLMFEI